MKRYRSRGAVGEGSSRTKRSKTSSGSAATRPHRDLRISVSLRCPKKGKFNDPKPSLSFEQRQRIHRGSSSSQPSPDLADGQRPAQRGSPAGLAPTAHPGQQSRERSLHGSNQDDDSELDDDHSDTSDDDECDGECLHDPWPKYRWESDTESDTENEDEFPWYEELDGLASLERSTDMPITSRRAARRKRRRERRSIGSCRAARRAARREERIIGSCNAKLIRRGEIRKSFHLDMEEPSRETSDLAFELFDRYGHLNADFYERGASKGTGVWGNELDRGDLLLFDEVTVDSTQRRRGTGTKLVNAILEKTREKVSERVGFFALARPGILREETSYSRGNPAATRKAQKAAMEAALGFWHALGFRRVGTSSWLAWTDSAAHPSRQLGIAQDWIHPDELNAKVTLPGEMERTLQRLSDPAIEAAKCIDELTEAFPEDFEDAQWQQTDLDGKTMLHVAALSCKPELVSFLVSRVPCLTAVRDKTGHTALGALQNQLERERTRRSIGDMATVVMSDEFEGFSDSAIKCLAVLEQTAVSDPSSLSPKDIEAVSVTDQRIESWARVQLDIAAIRKALRYKYGCTCGQCVGGFLSPRMKFALLCVAEVEYDNMQSCMNDKGQDWVAANGHLLNHPSWSVERDLEKNKSDREGFANMFSHFAKVLQQGKIPKERQVLDFCKYEVSESPPVTMTFLQRGGDAAAAAAANAIFETAMRQDEWAGDGHHREIFGEDIDRLVACRNDHEFGFVAGMCGYRRQEPGAPL